ncbi:MAG: DUF6653 family protein [Limisphaerales bacterium]
MTPVARFERGISVATPWPTLLSLTPLPTDRRWFLDRMAWRYDDLMKAGRSTPAGFLAPTRRLLKSNPRQATPLPEWPQGDPVEVIFAASSSRVHKMPSICR